MVRTHHIVGALAATGLLLTGCSSGSTATTPTTSSTTSPAPSSSSSTAAPSTPTIKATPKGDPNVPPAARAHTKAGAKAFVVAYMHQVNETGKKPRRGVLERLALDSCKSCNNFENQVNDLVRTRQHFSGNILSATPQEPRSFRSKSARVYTRVHQNAISVLSATGMVLEQSKVNDSGADFLIKWTGDRWRVAKIYDA